VASAGKKKVARSTSWVFFSDLYSFLDLGEEGARTHALTQNTSLDAVWQKSVRIFYTGCAKTGKEGGVGGPADGPQTEGSARDVSVCRVESSHHGWEKQTNHTNEEGTETIDWRAGRLFVQQMVFEVRLGSWRERAFALLHVPEFALPPFFLPACLWLRITYLTHT